jgi:hypothetical protein
MGGCELVMTEEKPPFFKFVTFTVIDKKNP